MKRLPSGEALSPIRWMANWFSPAWKVSEEVHYEAKPLSKLSPIEPIDGTAPISARRSP
jgi:hypothetical protein